MTTQRELPVDGRSIGQAFLRRVQLSPDQTAYLVKREGKFQSVTWKEIHQQVLKVFRFLEETGIQAGDKVCILSQTRPEWSICDLAIQCLGGVTVPIYPSNKPEDVEFILTHSGAKAIFAEDRGQLDKLGEIFQTLSPLPTVLISSMEQAHDVKFVSLSEICSGETAGVAEKLEASVATQKAEDTASIVYTSGTTGRPKGSEMTNENFLSELRAIAHEAAIDSDDTSLTFLPFAHILARVESLLPILTGMKLAFAESINSVPANLKEIRPSILVSVPRIYEKIFAKIQSGVASAPTAKQKLFHWAVGVGSEMAVARSEKKSTRISLQLQYALADKLVFSKVREGMGGKIRLTISGGAPLSPDLCKFFHACGIPILEGYGLTETTAAITCNRPDDFRFGSVGRPLRGVELKIAEDGEILARGPQIFKGYYNDPQATAEVLTEKGWFHTGDIGEIDASGFLRITDRKKEIIVTSAGKNIAPQKIENIIKNQQFISNAMVYGDKQKYLVAVITLDETEIRQWAKNEGIDANPQELSKNETLQDIIQAQIKELNSSLASYETIKRFLILDSDFTVENGDLTPSLKLKRKVILQKHETTILGLYQ